MKPIGFSVLFFAVLVTAHPAAAQVVKCSVDDQCSEGETCVKPDSGDPSAEGHCRAGTSSETPSNLQQEPPTPSGPPVNAAKAGILTGGIIDLTGVVLFLTGGAVSSLDLGVGLSLAYAGGGLLSVGSVVSSSSYTARHNAYRSAGYDVRTGYRAGSWVLTGITVACYGSALGVGFASEGDLGLALTSIGLNGLSAILEVVNVLSVRRKWDAALRAGAAKPRGVSFYPLFHGGKDPIAGRSWVLGVGATF